MELLGAALVLFSISFLAARRSREASRRAYALSALGLAEAPRTAPSLRRRLGLSARRYIERLGSLAARKGDRNLEELAAQAGTGHSINYLRGLRLACGIAAALAALPVGSAALVLSPLAFALGYRLPVTALKRSCRRRWERLAGDIPEVVDLMAVLCYAGEGLLPALRHSAGAGHPSVREEIDAALERIRLGESTHEALRHLDRHPCREMRRFSRTLLRADESGAPVAEILEDLATELRAGRREKERVRAARASVLILFPLVFMILPSFLLLTVGGMVLGYAL
jgi:tight adherence protein C